MKYSVIRRHFITQNCLKLLEIVLLGNREYIYCKPLTLHWTSIINIYYIIKGKKRFLNSSLVLDVLIRLEHLRRLTLVFKEYWYIKFIVTRWTFSFEPELIIYYCITSMKYEHHAMLKVKLKSILINLTTIFLKETLRGKTMKRKSMESKSQINSLFSTYNKCSYT